MMPGVTSGLTAPARTVLLLLLVVTGPARPAWAEDAWDQAATLDRLERDEARGGPYVRGGRSPFQTRFRVCNVMPTPVRDPKTGKLVTVRKEVCWWE